MTSIGIRAASASPSGRRTTLGIDEFATTKTWDVTASVEFGNRLTTRNILSCEKLKPDYG